jgi:hypothetical protein
MRETAAVKAHRLLVAGRLTVLHVSPEQIDATCAGDSDEHSLGRRRDEGWCCSCASFRRCSHVIALALVTPVEVLVGAAK